MHNPVTVILADDHQMLREGFKTMLRKHPEIDIVAEASNGKELISLVQQLHPHIVITDIKMPCIDGIEVCKLITANFPATSVIALSTFDNDHLIIDMLEAGAKGYLLKNTDKQEVVKAITTVQEGGTYFCESVSLNFHKLLAQTRHTPYRSRHIVEFSSRELDIIRLSCCELTNKEIAAKLNLSTRTIETHKERMQAKIEAKNMVGVIIYAIKNNLIALPD